MKKFKLVGGSYSPAGNKTYRTGDIVHSESDLVARFGPSMFELLGEVPADAPAPEPSPLHPVYAPKKHSDSAGSHFASSEKREEEQRRARERGQ